MQLAYVHHQHCDDIYSEGANIYNAVYSLSSPFKCCFMQLFSFAKEVVFVLVCLSVCLFVCQQLYAKTPKRICMKLSGNVGNRPMNK